MFKTFFQFINDVGKTYRYRIWVLFGLSVFTGLLEIMGIALIFPLISLVSDPSIVEKNAYLRKIYAWVGFATPQAMIYALAVSIGVVFILKNVYMMFYQHWQLSVVKNWRDDICADIMRKYLSAPFLYHLKRSSSAMINTLSNTVYFVLNAYVISVVTMASNMIVTMMLLGFIMLKFPLPSIVSGAVMVVLTFGQAKLIRWYAAATSEKMVGARARNLSVLTQAIAAIKETKTFGRENYFLDIYGKSNREISGHDKTALFVQYIPPYLNEIVLVIAIIVMCCLVLSQTMSPGAGIANLAVLAAVAFRLAPLVNRTLYAYSQMRVSNAATIELMDEVRALDALEHETLLPDVPRLAFHRDLSFDAVSFSYVDGRQALKDVTFTIAKGEFIGIVGPSGAGKTTLVDLLLGLLRPDAGAYTIDGQRIRHGDMAALRRLFGYVSQSPFLLDGTVRENIAFGLDPKEIDDNRVSAALAMASIDTFFRDRPDYLYGTIGDGGKTLSGGQRQRLAIARALYAAPDIIVLDEATSALDVETEFEITSVINALKGDKTIIAIAHRLSTLKKCDRIFYMNHGRLVDSGTFKELEARHADFSRMMELSSVTA